MSEALGVFGCKAVLVVPVFVDPVTDQLSAEVHTAVRGGTFMPSSIARDLLRAAVGVVTDDPEHESIIRVGQT
jgi:hypothetical protein